MRRLSMLAVVLALSTLSLSASAYDYYVVVEGTKQGKFKPECSQAAWKDAMQAFDFRSEIVVPVDPATGAASARTMHKPIIITKALGPSGPQFFQAAITSEVLKLVTISFVDGDGQVVYVVRLGNARVAAYRTYVGTVPGESKPKLIEEIALLYSRIDVEHKPGKTAASADTTK